MLAHTHHAAGRPLSSESMLSWTMENYCSNQEVRLNFTLPATQHWNLEVTGHRRASNPTMKRQSVRAHTIIVLRKDHPDRAIPVRRLRTAISCCNCLQFETPFFKLLFFTRCLRSSLSMPSLRVQQLAELQGWQHPSFSRPPEDKRMFRKASPRAGAPLL